MGIDVKSLSRCPTCQVPSIRHPLGVEGTLVGRSMIPGEAYLRIFKVEKPWARLEAEGLGDEAILAWELEQGAPRWVAHLI